LKIKSNPAKTVQQTKQEYVGLPSGARLRAARMSSGRTGDLLEVRCSRSTSTPPLLLVLPASSR